MERKPIPIVILSILYVFAPITNAIAACFILGMWPKEYFATFPDTFSVLTFLLVFPIAGWAIYSVKAWSYPVFITAMAWSLYVNLQTYKSFPHVFGLPMLIGAYALNLVIVAYFVLPGVRKPYYNPRLRWWEAKPRFAVDWALKITTSDKEIWDGRITDVSSGGMFIRTEANLKEGDQVEIETTFHFLTVKAVAKVRYQNPHTPNGFGIQYIAVSSESRDNICALIGALERLEFPRRPKKIKFSEEFSEWWSGVLRDRQGIIPRLPPKV